MDSIAWMAFPSRSINRTWQAWYIIIFDILRSGLWDLLLFLRRNSVFSGGREPQGSCLFLSLQIRRISSYASYSRGEVKCANRCQSKKFTWFTKHLHLYLHDLALGNVPLTCGRFCEGSLINHKPFWKHQAKPATFCWRATQQGQTKTPGTPSPTLFERCVGSFTSCRIVNNEELRDGAYRFIVLVREETTICRCNYKGSAFKCFPILN